MKKEKNVSRVKNCGSKTCKEKNSNSSSSKEKGYN